MYKLSLLTIISATLSSAKSKFFWGFLKLQNLIWPFQDHYPNGAEIVGFQVQLIHINEFEGPPENVMKQLLSYLTNVRSKREVSNEQTYDFLKPY